MYSNQNNQGFLILKDYYDNLLKMSYVINKGAIIKTDDENIYAFK